MQPVPLHSAAMASGQRLAESDAGSFMIRGQPVTVEYLQGGRHGQGRIRIEAREAQRLVELMRFRPRPDRPRRPPTARHHYSGIVVELGNPDD